MTGTKEQKVYKVFEKISDDYDKMNSVISFNQHTKWRDDMMLKLNVQEGTKALDVCCGTGDWTVQLAEAVGPTGEVIGLDFSESMLEAGRPKVSKYPNAQLMHGNAMELPFEEHTFDYVTIGFGLRNVPDYDQVLREMYRVVKPGGMVACIDTSHPEIPGYKQLFKFYFKVIMPMLGKVFAKSYEEYAWLQESTEHFPGMKTLAQMFVDAGFDKVSYKSYSGGAAAGHIGIKQ